MSFLKKSNETHVVIASGDAVYKINYRNIIKEHIQNGSDITVVYKEIENKDLTKFGILQTDENGRITGFEEKPIEPIGNKASLGVYIISRTLLIELLEQVIPEGRYDIVKDIIIRFRRKLKIRGYKFEGYWSNIGGGIIDYYDTNMDFLKGDIRDIFVKEYPYIMTKSKDEPPVKYNQGANFVDSIAGGGSIINGTVDHSVLFRRVYVGENSVVRNSVIMEGCYIGNNCVVENAIFDKNVIISEGKHVIGKEGKPIVLKKNSVL